MPNARNPKAKASSTVTVSFGANFQESNPFAIPSLLALHI